LNSVEGAEWLRREPNRRAFAGAYGPAVTVSARGCRVEVKHIPTKWLQKEESLYRAIEVDNGWAQGTIVDGRWRRAPQYWREGQLTAHLTLTVMEATTANTILTGGLKLEGAKLGVLMPEPEPRRCYRCQKMGRHACAAKKCKSANPVCGNCASIAHETRQCKAAREGYQCINCGEAGRPNGHAAWDRMCPEWIHNKREMIERQPELGFKMYPTKERDTWVS
ncbi:hypothetical protein FA15DRAFT_554464, partial [Coprinopsis marcescibilis]